MNFSTKEEIINGFIDAGCSIEQIEEVKKNISNPNILTEILVDQRKKVLNKIHEDEDKMKCIDYLLYKIKKEPKKINY